MNDRWAYKVSAGVYSQDPLARPTGTIPNGTGTQYPTYVNQGTTQPKLDVRVDYDFPDGKRKLIFQGGVAGTDGILHSGIGPFDIDQGTVLGYGKVNYSQNAMKLNFFTEHPQRRRDEPAGRGSRPASRCCSTSRARPTTSSSATCARSSSGTSSATAATSATATSICRLRRPATTRTEGGAYAQDEIFLGKYVRLAARRARGQVRHHLGRAVLAADDADVQADGGPDVPRVVQPRVPRAVGDQQLPRHDDHQPAAARRDQPGAGGRRSTTSRSAPSAATSACRRRFRRRIWSRTSITAYEVGYTGVIKQRATVSAAFFVNDTKDDIFFTQVASYRAANPPPGLAAAADSAVSWRHHPRGPLLPAGDDAVSRRGRARSAWATACRRRSATATSARCSRRASSWASTARSPRSGARSRTTRTSRTRSRSASTSPS